MKPQNWFLRTQCASDAADIEALNDEAFGPGRFVRTASVIREHAGADPELSLVGLHNEMIAGALQMTPVTLVSADVRTPAMLLGPLAVKPEFKGRGLGRLLVHTTLELAAQRGETAVVLVGDAPYYGPLGFEPVPFGQITLPGPVNPARLMVSLLNGAKMPSGLVHAGR